MGITANERNDSATAINSARTKWGLGATASNVSAGTLVRANEDVNQLNAWLQEAKNKCGSPQNIPENVSVNSIIRNPYPTLTSAANNIKNYCKCYGNCTGSCTGSCTGGCSGRCTAYCRNSTNTKSGQ